MSKNILIVLTMVCAAVVFAAPEQQQSPKQQKMQRQVKKETYRPPKLCDPGSWTMVVVPDVQAYVERPRNHGIVDIMNTWILDHAAPLRIQQVLFTGDLVYRNDQPTLPPDRKTVKATTFSPLFAIFPSTHHLAWMRNARNEFKFMIE